MTSTNSKNGVLSFLYGFFKDNPREVNFLLLLGALTFVVITIDLDTELAVEKDEIEQVIATLTNSTNTLTFDAQSLFIFEPPCIRFSPPIEIYLPGNDYRETPRDRSPPL